MEKRFVPDPSLTREEMERLQRDLAAEAAFEDDLPFDPATVDATLPADENPVYVGVDQAFLEERAVSAIVAFQGGEEIERVHAVTDLEIPYIPGLLAFREGGSILAAFEELSVDPDLAFFDGSGRIHYREAGLATHIGVILDLPSIGVAKSLLCGEPEEPIDELAEGTRVPILSNDRVTAPDGETIGYAFQSRQYESGARTINPLYVSPGHRVSAETAVDLVEQTCGEYKLPEPTRAADRYADEAKAEY